MCVGVVVVVREMVWWVGETGVETCPVQLMTVLEETCSLQLVVMLEVEVPLRQPVLPGNWQLWLCLEEFF